MTELRFELNDPADEQHAWTLDGVHSPTPIRPLAETFAKLVETGMTKTFQEYSIPVDAMRCEIVNGYLYTTLVFPDVPPDELERRAGEAQSVLTGIIPQVGELWRNTYLPEIQQLLGELESFDYDGASDAEMVAHWDQLMRVQRRLFEIHFLILFPAMLAVSEFDEMYRGLVGGDDPHVAYRVLGGIDNKTLETGRALFEISRKARADDEIMRVLSSSDSAHDVLAALDSTESGPAFLADLRAYLDEYGQRGDHWDVSYPSWIEDPTPVITNLRRYVHQESHPAADLATAAKEAERLLDEARAKLADEPMLPILEFLLAAAKEGIVISEDHGFWIDFRGGHRYRMACLAYAQRLVRAGAVDDVDDGWFLYADEVIDSMRTIADGGPAPDLRATVAQRRSDLDVATASSPPLVLGTPAARNDTLDDNPIARAFAKFSGTREASRDASGAIEGNPGSPGVVRGTARLIRSITDADRLDDGDILVAETTSPPWTPLFAIAGGVVCDAGGILSHAAVVAREYQIPAVLGCVDATKRIADGQLIEVDGDRGVVRIVS